MRLHDPLDGGLLAYRGIAAPHHLHDAHGAASHAWDHVNR